MPGGGSLCSPPLPPLPSPSSHPPGTKYYRGVCARYFIYFVLRMSSSRCRPKRQSAKRQGIRTPHLSTQAQGSEGTKCCGTVAALIWVMAYGRGKGPWGFVWWLMGRAERPVVCAASHPRRWSIRYGQGVAEPHAEPPQCIFDQQIMINYRRTRRRHGSAIMLGGARTAHLLLSI